MDAQDSKLYTKNEPLNQYLFVAIACKKEIVSVLYLRLGSVPNF